MKRLALVAVIGAVLAGGCSVIGGGGGGYTVVAYFPRAVSLFETSQVRVLGLPSGTVKDIEVQADRVKVTIQLNEDVPLPVDVKAALVAQSLIGERYVQLMPAWTDGTPRAEDGHVIELEDTIVPVEPDEALAALKKFLDSLDPEGLGRLIDNTATALEGNGESLGGALDEVSELVSTFAEKDQQLVAIVQNFDEFTATLVTREQQLGEILQTFAQATQVLADERQGLQDLLAGLADLSRNGLELVAEHAVPLRRDLEILQRLLASVDANLDAVLQLVDSQALFVRGIQTAYNPDLRAFNLRQNFGPLAQQILTPLLQRLIPGFPGLPCIPIDTACGAAAVQGQQADAAVSVALTAPRTPVDVLGELLAAPSAPETPSPSTADRIADAGAGVGSFLHDAAAALVGAG